MAPIVSGAGRPLVPIWKPIASSSMEIPKPAKAAVRSVVNASFSASSSCSSASLNMEIATPSRTIPPTTTAGVSNRAPTRPPINRPTSGITASKTVKVAAGRSGRIPRSPSNTATAKVSNPSGRTKAAILRNTASPSEGPLRAGEPSRCQGIAALSRSGGAAGAAMARFYRIELRRLSFRRSAPSRLMRHLDGQMRQRREARERAPVIVGLPWFRRDDRNNRPEVARPQAPEVEIGELVAITLNGLSQFARHAPVGVHVEQDRPGVADQAIGPTGDDASPDDAGERGHPEPATGARKQQAEDDKHRHRSVGNDVNHGCAHVVVARRRSLRIFVLFKGERIGVLSDLHICGEGVRLRNLGDRLYIAALIPHRENLPRAVRPDGFNCYRLRDQSGASLSAEPEAWRHAVLEHFKAHDAGSGYDFTRLIVILMIVASMRMAVAMAVIVAAATQEPGARDVDGQ